MLKVNALSKSYADKVIFNNFNLKINNNEFIAILGPNGAGKTTLLKLLSNLISTDKGNITFKDKNIKNYKISYIFQNPEDGLFPWLTVLENITLPLKLEGLKKDQRKKIAEEFCIKFKIDLPFKQYPYQLSGGQKQLTVVAQNLINNPDILLMDEPFSSLDFLVFQQIQEKLIEIWKVNKISVILASHRIEEAIRLSNRIIVLNPNPATIILDIKNDLPYPRSNNLLKKTTYMKLYKSINEAISKTKVNSF